MNARLADRHQYRSSVEATSFQEDFAKPVVPSYSSRFMILSQEPVVPAHQSWRTWFVSCDRCYCRPLLILVCVWRGHVNTGFGDTALLVFAYRQDDELVWIKTLNEAKKKKVCKLRWQSAASPLAVMRKCGETLQPFVINLLERLEIYQQGLQGRCFGVVHQSHVV